MELKDLFYKKKKALDEGFGEGDLAPPEKEPFAPVKAPKTNSYYEIKHKLHYRLVDEINLQALQTLDDSELKPEICEAIRRLLKEENVLFNEGEIQELTSEILHELKGFGPIEPFLKDPSISDILCNTYRDIYVERFGLLEKTGARFLNDTHMRNIIDRIVSRIGRRIDESVPMVDARLPDGSRVNAIIPPLAIDGPILSIRRFAVKPLKMEDLIRNKALAPDVGPFLDWCVKAKLNILISGGTGAGKTTLLNVLSGYIPGKERIVTIEDAAELQLQQEHVVRLETRPASIEGTGAVTQRDLVRNSLRMRPDRIIVGEVRGPEAFDMLQAMNTGHEGSLTTLHANSPRDSLTRLESMILMTGVSLPEKAMRFMVASALDMIIQVSRMTDGSRKLTSISEVVGIEGDVITLQDIFVFEKRGIDKDGRVLGRFKATGIRPKFCEKLDLVGADIPPELFMAERYFQ